MAEKKNNNGYRYSRYDTYDTDTPDTDKLYIDTPDTTYSHSPGNFESHIIIKTIYIGLLNYVKQNGYLKIFTELVWNDIVCRERGYLPSNL
jgi:hypothetical protein